MSGVSFNCLSTIHIGLYVNKELIKDIIVLLVCSFIVAFAVVFNGSKRLREAIRPILPVIEQLGQADLESSRFRPRW